MTTELPVLRLGLAGFTDQEQRQLAQAVKTVAVGVVHWVICELDAADAWLVNGTRVQDMGEGRIRINAGVPTARSIQLSLEDTERPMAFSQPCKVALPAFTFDLGSRPSLAAVLHKFETWHAALVAQFCLASHIVEHESALRGGVYELRQGDTLIAVVHLHGETAVLPSAGPADFDQSVWHRIAEDAPIPDNFVRATMSHLMWQFGTRTQLDVLPQHYRAGPIYFRRSPRVAHRLLDDAHLFLLRELANDAATFDALQRRSGLAEDRLAHNLAALYYVGSITSNPKRAMRPPVRHTEVETTGEPHSNLPLGLDSVPPDMGRHAGADPDMTAPAAFGPR